MESLAGVTPTTMEPLCVTRRTEADGLLHAPWTPTQVAILNQYQRADWTPSFYCGKAHDGGGPALLAQISGWRCPDPGCGFSRDWAFSHMADVSQWETSGAGLHGVGFNGTIG